MLKKIWKKEKEKKRRENKKKRGDRSLRNR